jgi:hypothetical protein
MKANFKLKQLETLEAISSKAKSTSGEARLGLGYDGSASLAGWAATGSGLPVATMIMMAELEGPGMLLLPSGIHSLCP